MTRTWDIFCSVVDNYGDIGVCWRLARQLSHELEQTVQLWVDDLGSFQRICRRVEPQRTSQRIDGVEIRHWGATLAGLEPADIVVEGFGTRLPGAYVEAMAARQPNPAWINLEYLSAESWVEGCHGLPSPHPRLPLKKHFFFPGFTPATGGLLIERDLAQTRDKFQGDPAAIAAFFSTLGLEPAGDASMRVSLFCYDNAALPALVEAWSDDSFPVVCIVPEGKVLAHLSGIVGEPIVAGSRVQRGRLTIAAIPFLDLHAYDRLLWACDVNFVRGEDSFVRAQLAARPLIWQAYPQQDRAHWPKIAAFLDRYGETLSTDPRAVQRALTEAWNRESTEVGRHWVALRQHRQALAAHARDWARRLGAGGNLAFKLAEFCEHRLK